VNNRRSEFEIIRDILVMSVDGAKKTQILYRTNLSYSQLQVYLSFLVRVGAVKIIEHGSARIYKTTPKGKEVLNHIEEAMRHLMEN